MKKIDARGLSCPEPVLLIREAMKSGDESYIMVTDNHAARENVTRYAEHEGYKVSVSENVGEYTMEINRR